MPQEYDQAEHALAGEPEKSPENGPISDQLEMADYQPVSLPIYAKGRGKVSAKLETTADGRASIRLDWKDAPHMWAEIELDFKTVRGLMGWWETSKWGDASDRALSDVPGAEQR